MFRGCFSSEKIKIGTVLLSFLHLLYVLIKTEEASFIPFAVFFSPRKIRKSGKTLFRHQEPPFHYDSTEVNTSLRVSTLTQELHFI